MNEHFTASLRRALYTMEILKKELEFLRAFPACKSGLKNHCINAERSMNAVKNSIILNVSPAQAAFIRTDLNDDRINDIGNLLHEVIDIQNVGDIYQAIKIVKEEVV